MDELVSVIIPTYKRKEKLFRTLKSVLDQSYKNIEVFIINDDLEDKGLEVELSNFKDTRIIFFNNERIKGANGARNTGVLRSKGKYIAFLDDDDELMKNAIETQYNIISKTDEEVGAVFGAYLMEKKSKWVKVNPKIQGNVFSDYITGRFSIGSGSNIFVKREVISNIGLWDETLARQQDLEFMMRVFDKYRAVFNNNVILKVYGHNEPNSFKAFKSREIYNKKITKFLKKLKKEDLNLYLSNHNRRQAFYLLKLGENKKAWSYFLRAFKAKPFSLRKDLKLIDALFRNILNINI